MKDLPYFRWWIARAETDERYSAMTDQELGFYHRCLNKAWVNNGLPADLDQLAKLMRVTREYLDEIWKAVGICWYSENGRFFNKTQEEERTFATARSEKATSAVRTRYGRNADVESEKSVGSSLELPRAYDSLSVSESKKKASLCEFPKEPSIVADTAERMYALHPKKKNKPLVETALLAIAQKCADAAAKFAEIEACHKAWCATDDWNEKNGKYAPQLAEWLVDEGYTKRPREPTESDVKLPMGWTAEQYREAIEKWK